MNYGWMDGGVDGGGFTYLMRTITSRIGTGKEEFPEEYEDKSRTFEQ